MRNVAVGSLGIPDAVLARARRTAGDISRSAADLGGDISIDADEILIGRAALLGLRPAGRISAGGATRLLATRDGWCALTLSRDDDVQSVPALLETNDEPADPWMAVTTAAAGRDAAEFVSMARLLDLPAAILGEVRPAPPRFAPGGLTAPRHMSELLVADLSSMWAGPLCGHLLAAAGATVVKVKPTARRPDGTRGGDSRFFDWMDESKLSYVSIIRDGEAADWGSRAAAKASQENPLKALTPLPNPHQPHTPGLSPSPSGATTNSKPPEAFGDDAAVAGGLVGVGPTFVGDAIADPLTGLSATQAVLESLRRGGGEVVEVSWREVAADYAASPLVVGPEKGDAPRIPALPPQSAAALGADNHRVRQLIETRLATC